MIKGVGKLPTAKVFHLSSSLSANKSSAVWAARQTEQSEEEHELVQSLAAGGDEEDGKTILLTLSNLVLNETK